MKFDKQPIVHMTKKVDFCIAHRLVNKDLSEAENIALYDKCYNPNGHGHNYALEVTLKAPISERTGMVMNFSILKTIIQDHVVELMDHKHLNEDVIHFKDLIPTAENVIVVIWQILQEQIAGNMLYKLVLRETDVNIVEYYGEVVGE
ncbi:MAG: 6-carboxytetrahydropterin synthase [Rickettsiales bacterium]|jgi:6-pyruvoyltetrahydropterin/6-carboxytetrahydropterin synthase|nr:6-carboxytetrahydropterin synthase [Rickettsiales bacterium]